MHSIPQDHLANKPGYWLLKSIDEDLSFHSISPLTANILGYKTWEAAIGDRDYDLPCRAREHAEVFRSHDREVYNSAQTITSFGLLALSNGDKHLFTIEKSIHIDSHTRTRSLLCHRHLCTTAASIDFAHNISMGMPDDQTTFYYTIKNPTPDNRYLNTKESECLFYLLRGYNTMAISARINLDTYTIESLIDTLCFKWRLQKKQQLIDYMIENNLYHFIPPTLFANATLAN